LYRALNTLRLGCKNQAVQLYSEIIAICSKIHTKLKLCVGRTQNLWMLNLLVRVLVTTGLQKV